MSKFEKKEAFSELYVSSHTPRVSKLLAEYNVKIEDVSIPISPKMKRCRLSIYYDSVELYNLTDNKFMESCEYSYLPDLIMLFKERYVKKGFFKVKTHCLDIEGTKLFGHYKAKLHTVLLNKNDYVTLKCDLNKWVQEAIKVREESNIATDIRIKKKYAEDSARYAREAIEKSTVRTTRMKNCYSKLSYSYGKIEDIYLTLDEQVVFLEHEITELDKIDKNFKRGMTDILPDLSRLHLETIINKNITIEEKGLIHIMINFSDTVKIVEKILGTYKKELGQLLRGVTAGVEGER